MPTIYLSPSTQEYNAYVIGGSEEYYMNLLADALEPYLIANGIGFVRNDPNTNAAAAIRQSNAGNFDLHLALHSNAASPERSGQMRGIDIYLYPGSIQGRRAGEIFLENFKSIYPLPNRVRILTTTRLGEVRQTKAPSVFLEIGYHDNPEDARWIVDNIPTIARSIALSLTEYFDIPFAEPDLAQRGRVTLSSGTLNLREAPSVNSAVLLGIPNGAELTVQDDYNGWYSTRYNGVAGYVNASYVNLEG